jgi:pimeloyl-ACP methyl ester carboxylesterase
LCAGEIADGIKGSRKVIVEDSEHAIFVEQPEAFEREVAEFLGP